MKTFFNYTLLLIMASMVLSCQDNKPIPEINIIPKPLNIIQGNGSFTLKCTTPIVITKAVENITPAYNIFNRWLSKSLGQTLPIRTGKAEKNAINITVIDTLQTEEYILDIQQDNIQIIAGSPKAVSYAFQSIRQLLTVDAERGVKQISYDLPVVTITDTPRYAYRGMMLDVCRHFFTVEEVKTFIDMLALHKLERFHWHLSDDQGWRIEIKKYPKLTEIGSKRPETVIGKNSGKFDGKPIEGFYTQEQIQEVVKYAADRYITIIPEIELPGHALAALASYPELGCTEGPYEVWKQWGVADEVFCAGKEQVFAFMEDVFDEIIPLFPSEYIHIGGDECPKTAWENCRKCQQRMRKENLKDEEQLQSYFIQRIEKYINSKGKKIIGWDEILEGGLSKTATVMSWRGTEGGIAAAKMGNKVIMAPNTYVYFDYYQSEDREKEPFTIGGFINVERVYSLEPAVGLNDEESECIIGVQANAWSEYMKTFDHVQYMTLPRMAALAEVAWLPKGERNFPEFTKRAIHMMDRYKALGYRYAEHLTTIADSTTKH